MKPRPASKRRYAATSDPSWGRQCSFHFGPWGHHAHTINPWSRGRSVGMAMFRGRVCQPSTSWIGGGTMAQGMSSRTVKGHGGERGAKGDPDCTPVSTGDTIADIHQEVGTPYSALLQVYDGYRVDLHLLADCSLRATPDIPRGRHHPRRDTSWVIKMSPHTPLGDATIFSSAEGTQRVEGLRTFIAYGTSRVV
ncbi:hypothetical protein AAG570_009120 [Ranatra chinensis]|uniref:LysM domain-containing protein n=1 Tax=Ranatra chinensis TaxID=642074 RepID=A0ABD0YST9_9HEMI